MQCRTSRAHIAESSLLMHHQIVNQDGLGRDEQCYRSDRDARVLALGRRSKAIGADALDVAVCGDENPWS